MTRGSKTNQDFLPEVFASSEAAAQSAASDEIQDQVKLQDWTSQNGWGVIVARTRLDAFSHEQMVSEIDALRREGCVRIAVNMRANRFLSLQTIRYLVTLGEELRAQKGRVSLVAPVEKIKRHFEIYGSLKTISIVRFVEELTRVREVDTSPLASSM